MGDELQSYVKKGTTTVGIVCKDGIILAADKRATLGGRIISHKKVNKVVPISKTMAITTAGTVSDIQLITKLVRAELMLLRIRLDREPSVKMVSNLLGAIVYQNIRKFSPILGITGFLLGGVDESGFSLYEIGPDGSVLGHDNFITDGSGMMMAFGVLDTLYKPTLNLEQGKELAIKCILAALERDTATGSGIDVFAITKDGVTEVYHKELDVKSQF